MLGYTQVTRVKIILWTENVATRQMKCYCHNDEHVIKP